MPKNDGYNRLKLARKVAIGLSTETLLGLAILHLADFYAGSNSVFEKEWNKEGLG